MMPTDETFESKGLLIKVMDVHDYNSVIQFLWHRHLACWVNGKDVFDYSPIGTEVEFPFYLQVFYNNGKFTVGCADVLDGFRQLELYGRKLVSTSEFFAENT